MAAEKSVFVTVGSTLFDSLIRAATAPKFSQLLVDMGYKKLTLQIGRGSYTPEATPPVQGLSVSWYRYKDTIKPDMQDADLIISHGGSGSILESLCLGKALVVVVNEELMDNHQTELAEEMDSLGHLLYTTPQELHHTVEKLPQTKFKKYVPGDPHKLGQEIDHIMGFTS